MHVQSQAWNLPAVVVIYLALTVQLSCATSVISMITLLVTCTKEGQCAVIRFLWDESVEIQHRFSAAFCCSQTYTGIDMFTSGQTSVTGEEQSGHLSTLTAEWDIKQI
jgi:hypothetical protein